MKIQPIITANQVIANKTRMTSPFSFGNVRNNEYFAKGEKLDINCTGCREYSLNGKKINYFA